MRVGNREVVGSGSLVTHEDDETLEISYSNLNVKIIFETKEEGTPKADVEADGNFLTLTLSNFDSSLGSTFNSQIGTIPGPPKRLYFSQFTFNRSPA